MKKPKRLAKPTYVPYECFDRFGILNHTGDIWTPETFETAAEAEGHIGAADRTWAKGALANHRVVRVQVVVSFYREVGDE